MLNPEPFPEAPPAEREPPFDDVLQRNGRIAVWFRLSGELDIATAPRFTRRLDEAFPGLVLIRGHRQVDRLLQVTGRANRLEVIGLPLPVAGPAALGDDACHAP